MARTITFDPLAVVRQTMELFWRRGYKNTSVDDIVTATGLTKHSLYGQFGSKGGLFKTCLQFYVDSVTARFQQPLEQGRGLSAIRAFFDTVIAGNSRKGCLMTRTVCELTLLERDAKQLLRGHYQNMENLLYQRLLEAEADGTLKPNVDCRSTARLLLCVVQGAVMVGMEKQGMLEAAPAASVLDLISRS
jgi:TetR/AcrR family transcriptional regulator, transcriptional repressor for nem operon